MTTARYTIDQKPVFIIDPSRCIGCEACVAVCPTKVLDLVNHKVVVARFDQCVQCEQCANKCPTTALVMHRLGEQPSTLTVPELDEHFIDCEFEYVAHKLDLTVDQLRAIFLADGRSSYDYKSKRALIEVGSRAMSLLGLEKRLYK